MKQCPVCKMTLPDDSGFCQYCGAKISIHDSTQEKNGVDGTIHELMAYYLDNDGSKQANHGDTNTDIPVSGKKGISITSSSKNVDKPKKRSLGIAAWICVGLFVAALITCNIIQFSTAQKKNNQTLAQITTLEEEVSARKAENDSLNNTVANLESEKNVLEKQIEDIEALKIEKADLEKKVEELEKKKSTADDLNKKINELNTKVANLNAKITDLEKTRESFLSLNTLVNNSGTHYDDYYPNTEVVIVKINQIKLIRITSTLKNTTVWYKSNNMCSEGRWTNTWDGNTTTFEVTGKQEGTTVYTFTNEANDHSFKVYVVVAP